MIIKEDYAIFSDGRSLYTHNGVIGIGVDLRASEGWEGRFDDDNEMSPENKVELATYMIRLWEQYRKKAEV